MAKNKYYVFWSGRNPGIYSDWEVCKREIMGCKDAKGAGLRGHVHLADVGAVEEHLENTRDERVT